ncbi:membrane progestin receptor beta-like [Anneissia japonica]|uniref:membrane progestin receptor beta-like n=1 Tax=Anneissia japonica TaxID=1529436 RepID=UPI001425A584|nr:membrane progestin receptor beta-like [Anneissia japonica]XP_033122802.1 membrane progestin receptor beta-like [Anneissia japonica]XP_033122803.1 membrane progestin receptor beta-like [Anneissia japonica]XP_033122804.1 membrane progestin receptor beta-like [Anneissia japonica]XP_033122805.1 membrane progestin receptor beta-like [Anneissia japonica]XP_033122806.1 membrane progestin receptor beta-like [Anneissia japonica]XP_033122807.1 membrane progestin receptor beta-like [Anneissia japonic
MWFIDTSLSDWLKHKDSQDLQTEQEVPTLFREPYIKFGYRRPHQPLIYYFKSLFQFHNETLNVWTHGLGCLVVLWKSIQYCYHLDFNDQFCKIFFLFCFSSCVYLLLSMLAHLLHSHSDLMHHVSFFFDYMGVSVYGLGGSIGCFFLASDPEFLSYIKAFYMPLAWTFTFLTCACCTYAKYRYQRPYPPMRKVWQMLPAASGYMMAMSPLVHRMSSGLTKLSLDGSERLHAAQMCLFVISSFFFSVPFPQKWTPGRFDILGHSHQLFHVFMVGSTSCLMDALFLDLKQRRNVYSDIFEPTSFDVYGYMIALIAADLVIIMVFRELTKHKIKKEKEQD